ncbi:MAG: hypothetical protein WA908_10105 [Pontixanthobacter sp.]
MDSDAQKKGKDGGSWQAMLGIGLCAFLLGALVVGYATWDGTPQFAESFEAVIGSDEENEVLPIADEPAVGAAPSAEASTPTIAENASPVQQNPSVARVAEQQGGLDQRLAAAEQRLARLDLQAQAASGNAARAEGLLIAFAARRSLERGAELGYLADQLRLRFSDALPNAVDTIIASSRDPITIDRLIARLEKLGPQLADTTEEPSFARFQRELGELFIIRRESAPSPQPQRRLERARRFLQSGRVAPAIDEVRQLPGAANARKWIADAERYAAAQRALDLIETSAVVEPQRLRDGEGAPVRQPTPGQENLIR